MAEVKEIEKCTKMKIAAMILAAIAIGLFIGGFFVPPMGIIDGSVIKAVGEIIGMITIFLIWEIASLAINKNADIKLQKGDSSISVNLPNGKEDEE